MTDSHAIVKYETPDSELNIYPYGDLNWLNYVDRFKFKIPETIVTKADGTSICNNCKQVYVGYQEKCVRPRYGYKDSYYSSSVQIGHMLVGEKIDRYGSTVRESGLYPCNHYCTWNKYNEFSKQNSAFNEFNLVISKMCNVYVFQNLEMDTNDVEKWNLIQQIDSLKFENDQIKYALKEVVSRLNAGGSGLMGGINF